MFKLPPPVASYRLNRGRARGRRDREWTQVVRSRAMRDAREAVMLQIQYGDDDHPYR